MERDSEALAQDYALVWDAHAPADLADRLFAADAKDHNLQPGQGPGIDGIKQIISLYHAVFPDLSVTAEDVVASGDRVTVRWSATGTHEGDQLGVPATRRRIRLTGIDVLKVADGRIVERWGEANGLEMMQQITAD